MARIKQISINIYKHIRKTMRFCIAKSKSEIDVTYQRKNTPSKWVIMMIVIINLS